MQRHKTVKIWYEPYKCYFNIDKNIAPLINEIWKAGIETDNSCEDNIPEIYDYTDTCFWISFSSGFDFYMFLDIVFNGISRNSDFFSRTRRYSKCKLRWKYSIWIDTPDDDPIKRIYISYSVRFPGCDYAYVLGKLCDYNINNNINDIKYGKLIGNTEESIVVLEKCDSKIKNNTSEVFNIHCRHDQTNVYVDIFEKQTGVDKNIAPLIHELNKAKIDVVDSCENYFKNKYDNTTNAIYIEFSSSEDLQKFIEILIMKQSINSDFCKRVLGYSSVKFGWAYKVNICRDEDMGSTSDKRLLRMYKNYNCVDGTYIIPSLMFSGHDYDWVLRTLRRHNAK